MTTFIFIGNLHKRNDVKMTPAKKIYNTIKMGLIEKYGEDFLNLTVDEQNNLIIDELQKYINKTIKQK